MPLQSQAGMAERVHRVHYARYLWAVLLLVSGCATVNPQAGFSDVQAAVEARSGKRVAWSLGTELDAQVAQDVQVLLRETRTADGAVQVALLNNRTLQALYAELAQTQHLNHQPQTVKFIPIKLSVARA